MKYKITYHDAVSSECTRDLLGGGTQEAESAMDALRMLGTEQLLSRKLVDLKSWKAQPYQDSNGGMTSAALTCSDPEYQDCIVIAALSGEDG